MMKRRAQLVCPNILYTEIIPAEERPRRAMHRQIFFLRISFDLFPAFFDKIISLQHVEMFQKKQT